MFAEIVNRIQIRRLIKVGLTLGTTRLDVTKNFP